MRPGTYQRTSEIREKNRQASLGKKYFLGHKHSPEAREKMRQTLAASKHVPYERTPEHRERMRQLKVGNKYWLGRKHTLETKEKMREAALGRTRSPETREKVRRARLRRHFPTKMTSIECLLHDEFKRRRLKFEMHKTMFGRFQPDFVFEQARLIVQADGDYWHSLSKHVASDATFNKLAHAEGWSVWRFGEREIHMHAAACARAVARFVRDHQP